MAKKTRSRKRQKTQSRKTNWTLIIGVVVVGIVALIGLLALSLRQPDLVSLAARCQEDEAACVTRGQPDAPVTIIEVLDFGCSYCRDYHEQTAPQIAAAYVETGQVQVVYYPYALRPETILAASASLCAQEQEAYLAYTDAVFDQFNEPDALSRDGLLRAAETAGLEISPFTSCLDNGRYDRVVQENVNIARLNRINSTPTFLINGRPINGAFPFATFQQQIEGILNSS